MKQIKVITPSRHYAVFCEQGLLGRIDVALRTLKDHTGIFVISSPRVWRHWGWHIERGLRPAGPVQRILFHDAELSKNLPTVEKICRRLVRAGADRKCILVAVGGGVVGDVAGFVAAAYLRGVRLVHVPTTLVAQVDSAIGGKTGVNLPEGKNLVGAFYQPGLVLADPQVLKTLPARQCRSGIFEVIKYGIIGDTKLFAYLEANLAHVIARSPRHLEFVIERCIAAKARIVAVDERESGLREVLNLGHTFAHALETATGYRRFLHGEAVGWGLMAAAQLAVLEEMLPQNAAARIVNLVRRVGRLPAWPQVGAEKLMDRMRTDKKTRAGRLRFVLPRAIGKVQTGVQAQERAVKEVLRQMAESAKSL